MSECSGANGLVRYVLAGAAIPSLDASQSLEILHEIGDRGQRSGVTGVLMSEGRDFLQVLEGPRDKVEELYLSISLDRRQHRLLKLLDEPLGEREFAELSLACRQAGKTVFQALQENRQSGVAGRDDPAGRPALDNSQADGRVERLMVQFSEGRWRRSE